MKNKIILIVKILLVILILISAVVAVYGFSLSSVSNESNNEKVDFKIAKGETVNTILKNLKENNLIRSEFFTKLYIKINNKDNLQAGTYVIDNSFSTQDIIDILLEGKIVNEEEIKITFPEGITIRHIAKIIEKETNNKESDVFDLLKDQDYLDSLIKEYWFIDEIIKDKDIIYPLEGYLAMNTYIYKNKDVTVKEIFKKMLDQMDNLLTKYKDDFIDSTFTAHNLLTFSSIVQSEGLNFETMNLIAGVFYNRLEKNMAFQSCPTNCYPRNIEPCYPSKVDAKYESPYNTYLSSMAGKLPIGPVSSFGEDALKASIFPGETDDLFFLSDKNGKIYFNKTNAEHEKKIKELKDKGLWF